MNPDFRHKEKGRERYRGVKWPILVWNCCFDSNIEKNYLSTITKSIWLCQGLPPLDFRPKKLNNLCCVNFKYLFRCLQFSFLTRIRLSNHAHSTGLEKSCRIHYSKCQWDIWIWAMTCLRLADLFRFRNNEGLSDRPSIQSRARLTDRQIIQTYCNEKQTLCRLLRHLHYL